MWVATAADALRGRLSVAELERTFAELLALLVEAVETGVDVTSEDYAGARGLLSELSRDWARRGFTPTETTSAIYSLKEALFGPAQEVDLATVLAVSRWVDALGLVTFESYARAREMVISEQAEQLLELTTPVVKLWEGVVAVPLIGTLDSARTQIVMEKLLQTLVDTGSEHAIIDITGVPAVDTEVAQHLLKTVVAARLMGAECTISGIRPQIAQTIVALGIDFGDIPTKATLADALLHALRGTGVEVVRRQRSRST
jgi:rsbT co-antagonist protein RsbR